MLRTCKALNKKSPVLGGVLLPIFLSTFEEAVEEIKSLVLNYLVLDASLITTGESSMLQLQDPTEMRDGIEGPSSFPVILFFEFFKVLGTCFCNLPPLESINYMALSGKLPES